MQKRALLDDFIQRSNSRAVENRGSSLFIKRVADLEQDSNIKKAKSEHFKDASGAAIEMSQHSPFADGAQEQQPPAANQDQQQQQEQ